MIHEIDGHDPQAVKEAILEAQSVKDKPSLIICRTVIGFGSPNKAGKEEAHGAPLGKKKWHWHGKNWAGIIRHLRSPKRFITPDAREKGEKHSRAGMRSLPRIKGSSATGRRVYSPDERWFTKRLGKTTQKYINELQANPAKIATRKASQNTLNAYGPMLPELLGGSADLAPSNLTIWKGSVSLKEDPAGNYIHYGVREFGMTAIANGIAHHGGFVPYTATF